MNESFAAIIRLRRGHQVSELNYSYLSGNGALFGCTSCILRIRTSVSGTPARKRTPILGTKGDFVLGRRDEGGCLWNADELVVS